MCGRYLYFEQNNKRIRSMLQQLQMKLPAQEYSSLSLEEVFPSQKTPVCILDDHGKWQAEVMRWGIQRKQAKGLIINARSETASSSPLFQTSLKQRRCLILASGYYEWDKEKKEKILFRFPDESALYLAGFYHQENQENHFVIMTRNAQPEIEHIHSRMPVLFHRNQAQGYLMKENQFDIPVNLSWQKI